LWTDDVRLKQESLDSGDNVILKDINFKMLDIPELHSFVEPRSAEFFNVLSKVKNMDIFGNEVVRALIDLKWPLVKEYTVKILFMPFLLYLLCFVAFSNVFNGQLTSEKEEET